LTASTAKSKSLSQNPKFGEQNFVLTNVALLSNKQFLTAEKETV
jgi:hypothetical protein